MTGVPTSTAATANSIRQRGDRLRGGDTPAAGRSLGQDAARLGPTRLTGGLRALTSVQAYAGGRRKNILIQRFFAVWPARDRGRRSRLPWSCRIRVQSPDHHGVWARQTHRGAGLQSRRIKHLGEAAAWLADAFGAGAAEVPLHPSFRSGGRLACHALSPARGSGSRWACAKTATTVKAGNPMSGFFHWQREPNLILIGGITAVQTRWGVRGSNPEPTD